MPIEYYALQEARKKEREILFLGNSAHELSLLSYP